MDKPTNIKQELPFAGNIPTDELMFYLVPLEGSEEDRANGEQKRESLALEMAARLESDERPEQFRKRLIQLVTWINLDRDAGRWSSAPSFYYDLYKRFISQMHPSLSIMDEEHISPCDVDSTHLGWDVNATDAAFTAIGRKHFSRYR